MAKVQSFAEKAAKLARKHDTMVLDPETNKETRLIYVRLVSAVKSPKGSYKFLERNARVYESTYKPFKP